MTTNTETQRVDEVSSLYEPVARIGKAIVGLFWIAAVVSLVMPYAQSLLGSVWHDILKCVFLVLVLVQFCLSQASRFYLIPRAERTRRRQLLSDAFGTRLTHERTALYYNNDYVPSVERLGANTLENSLFSKEVAARMLIPKRWTVVVYLSLWVLAFALRHNNLEILTWITQVVFSGEILASWLTLESLRFRHERTYDQLHAHFLHGVGDSNPRAIADVLDAFVAYESAKSSAGTLLSSMMFNELNPELTAKWEQIKRDIGMIRQQEDSLDEEQRTASHCALPQVISVVGTAEKSSSG